MMSDSPILKNFQAYAESLIEIHKVPAISLAVWHKQQLHQAAAGTLNIETGVEATTDSIFQIGSITKAMTTSLIMQLVDEGRVELDSPVKHYIRDFCIADPGATESITVRQLLNHTSGMAGDYIPDDTHDSGNPISRFVDRCYLLPQVHSAGDYYSYSNSAFVVAGRLVEVVTGSTWFDAMEERIFQPLGMSQSICRPMDVLRYRAAMGHVTAPHTLNHWQQAERPYLSMAHAPAGSTATMTAADLVTFARAHLNHGLTLDNQRWLSENAVAQMQQPQVELPSLSTVTTSHTGLSWGLHRLNHNGRLIFGHGGGTLGQSSMLRIVPDSDIGIVVLTNCDNAEFAYQTVINELLKELADIDLTEPEPSFVTVHDQQLTHYLGDYQSAGEYFSFAVDGNQLTATYKHLALNTPATTLRFKALDETLWIGFNEEGIAVTKLRFLNPDAQGVYAYLFNGQMIQRIS